MNYKHAADLKIAKWVEDIFKTAAPEDTGTNEPVKVPEEAPAEEAPAEEAPAEEAPTEEAPTEEKPAEETGETPPAEGELPPEDPNQLPEPEMPQEQDMGSNPEIEDIKKQLEELKNEKSLQSQIDILKRKLDRLHITDDSNLNDSIFQSASVIKHAQRQIRRWKNVAGLWKK